jgi:A/G-specific adenine glycosylase
MLQQTRTETAGAYYQRWLQLFPDLATLAAAPEELVLKAWEGLGYYARARNLRVAAALVLERHGGQFPRSLAEARQLPGVGEYIAAAVLSIAYALPHGVVDGNTIRVVSRLSADASPVSDRAFRRRVRTFVEASFGALHPGWVNQAWMELGALVCTPSGPRCGECPLAQVCRARLLGRVEELPSRARSRALPAREESALLLVPGRFRISPTGDALLPAGAPLLLVRRASHGLLGGLWELPAWPLRGESLRTGLEAEGIKMVRTLDFEVTHTYSHFRQRLQAVLAVFRTEQSLEPWVEQRWVAPAELERYPRPGAHIKLLRALGLDAGACPRAAAGSGVIQPSSGVTSRISARAGGSNRNTEPRPS